MATDSSFVATGPADIGVQVTGTTRVGIDATGTSVGAAFHLPTSTFGASAVTADHPLANARLCTFTRSVVSHQVSGIAVFGHCDAGFAIRGESDTGNGLFGQSTSADAIFGASASGRGIFGESSTNHGIQGQSESEAHAGVSGINLGAGLGVWGVSQGGATAVLGQSPSGVGVRGESQSGTGVLGLSHDPTNAGVSAQNDRGGVGLRAESNGGIAAHFQGDVEVVGHLSVDNISVTGDVFLANRDLAELFAISPAAACEPGALMVIGDGGALEPCTRPYDKRAIGVVSGAGTRRPAITLGAFDSSERTAPIAMVGTACCLADADLGAIEAGDLLTSSSTPGHAMRAADADMSVGAIVGKALAPLREGRALIPILISLQ
jgi:hypothetical protein